MPTSRTPLITATCAAALLSAPAAWADVTPEDVWEDWKALLSVYGEESVSWGDVSSTGGVLTVPNVRAEFSDDYSTGSVEMGDLVFTDLGDGTVRVTFPDRIPVLVAGQDGETAEISVSMSNQNTIVSGEPGAMRYDITADRTGIALDSLVVDGEPADVTASLVMNNVDGTYSSTLDGEIRRLEQSFSASDAELFIDAKNPDLKDDYANVTGQMQGLTVRADMSYEEGIDFDDPEALFEKGFALDAGYALEQGAYVFDVSDAGKRSNGSASTGPARLDLVMGLAEGISYDARVEDLKTFLGGDAMPLPVEFEAGSYTIGFQMPLAPSDLPKPLRLEVGFVDIVLSEQIWGIFDPGQKLPRDPASIELAISGEAIVTEDLMNPEAMEGEEMPFELQSASIDKLRIDAVGLSANGAGSFTFDNEDLSTYEGFPRPEGRAEVTITGLNTLLDTLVEMGLLPQDQVMGMRMMSGMFLRATGDDTLQSVVEIDKSGALRVNDQRLR